jgi:5S rRNA maturation endonuclease (ribonuclease M5)
MAINQQTMTEEHRKLKCQRVFICLDPDYAGADARRYPWLGV